MCQCLSLPVTGVGSSSAVRAEETRSKWLAAEFEFMEDESEMDMPGQGAGHWCVIM